MDVSLPLLGFTLASTSALSSTFYIYVHVLQVLYNLYIQVTPAKIACGFAESYHARSLRLCAW